MLFLRQCREKCNPVCLIRLMVGAVFLSEGIQKFLFSDALGVGRFIKIGIPFPSAMAPFVGIVETVCGSHEARTDYAMLLGLLFLILQRTDSQRSPA